MFAYFVYIYINLKQAFRTLQEVLLTSFYGNLIVLFLLILYNMLAYL